MTSPLKKVSPSDDHESRHTVSRRLSHTFATKRRDGKKSLKEMFERNETKKPRRERRLVVINCVFHSYAFRT
jgi:hypothetical protein